jgi:hypothetical protein
MLVGKPTRWSPDWEAQAQGLTVAEFRGDGDRLPLAKAIHDFIVEAASKKKPLMQLPWIGAASFASMMMKQFDEFWKKLPRRARNCELLAYHYSEIGTNDLKQIVQSADT